MQKFYLHDASTTVAGTLPGTGASQSSTTPTVSAAGSGTNRSMNSTVGVAQVAQVTLATGAVTTAQTYWFRRFVSPLLAAQNVPTGAWTMRLAGQESNASANYFTVTGCLYFWRPSTGLIVGSKLYDAPTTELGAEYGTTETDSGVLTLATSTGPTLIQDGDVLIFELWGNTASQGTATSRTVGVYYDGTTEGSTSSNAAYINAPNDLELMQAPTVVPRPWPSSGLPKINPASVYMRLKGNLREPGGSVPTVYRPVNAVLAGTSSLSGTFTEYHAITLSLSGTSSLTATVVKIAGAVPVTQDYERPSPRRGVPHLLPLSLGLKLQPYSPPATQAAVYRPVNITLAGTSSLSSNVTKYHRLTVAIAGTSSLSATFRELHRIALTLAGTSSISTTITELHRIILTLAGTSSLSSTITELHRFSATFAGISTLTFRFEETLFTTSDAERPSPRRGIPHLRPLPLTLKLQLYQPPGPIAGVTRPINITIVGTSSLSTAVTEIHRFAVTIAGSSSLSSTIRELHRFTANIAGTSSLSATITEYHRITLTLAGKSTLSATFRELHRITLTLAGTSSIAATFRELHRFTANLSGVGHISANITEYQRIHASVAGVGTLNITLNAKRAIKPSLAGVGHISAAATEYHRITASFAGRSSIASIVRDTISISSHLMGTSTFVANISEFLIIPVRFFVTDTISPPPFKANGIKGGAGSAKPVGDFKSDTPRGGWIIRR